MFDEEITFHLKRLLRMSVITSETVDTYYCQVQGERNFVHVSIMHQACFWHLRGTKYCTWNDCVAILWKGVTWKFIFPRRKINWHVLQIAQVHDVVHDFWKKYHKFHVSSTYGTLHTYKVSARHTKQLCTRICNSFSL